MTALFAFLVIIIVAVFVHEMGHYIAARVFGVRVMRFSVGFGKPLARKVDKRGTEWVLAPIPLGGYVQMLDAETAKRAGLKHEQSLEGVDNWKRFIVYAAGPFANIVLTAVLATMLALDGEVGLKPVVGKVFANSPAAKAGARSGDEMTSVNGEAVQIWAQAADVMVDAVIDEAPIKWTTTNGATREIPGGEIPLDSLDSGLLRAIGIYPDDSYLLPKLVSVVPGGAGDVGGLREGDIIGGINGVYAETWSDVRFAIADNPGETMTLVIGRGERQIISVTVTMGERLRNGRREGVLGIIPTLDRARLQELATTVHLGLGEAMATGIALSGEYVIRTFAVIRHIVIGNVSPDNLSGPVGIAMHAESAAKSGFGEFLRFLAFISASLAAINLLPLPLLDGGQMIVCIIQAARRKPLSPATVSVMGKVGGALLFTLMLYVIVNDFVKLWG